MHHRFVIPLLFAVAVTTAFAAPPTAKEMGVPVYPGSQFDADLSAGMSSGDDTQAWIFRSSDTPATIAAFYEKATGRKAQSIDGAYRIVLKGEGLIPAHSMAIEPNTFGGPGKTVITVLRVSEE